METRNNFLGWLVNRVSPTWQDIATSVSVERAEEFMLKKNRMAVPLAAAKRRNENFTLLPEKITLCTYKHVLHGQVHALISKSNVCLVLVSIWETVSCLGAVFSCEVLLPRGKRYDQDDLIGPYFQVRNVPP